MSLGLELGSTPLPGAIGWMGQREDWRLNVHRRLDNHGDPRLRLWRVRFV